MFQQEWKDLLSQLEATRGATTTFISFVDTVSARNFAGTNDCHGWVELRFQTTPFRADKRCDSARKYARRLQRSAAGSDWHPWSETGLRCLPLPATVEEFLGSLMEDLSLDRIEIDCVELTGPVFQNWDANFVTGQPGYRWNGRSSDFRHGRQAGSPGGSSLQESRGACAGPIRSGRKIPSGDDSGRPRATSERREEQNKGSIGLFTISVEPPVKALQALSAERDSRTRRASSNAWQRGTGLPRTRTLQDEFICESLHQGPHPLRRRALGVRASHA